MSYIIGDGGIQSVVICVILLTNRQTNDHENNKCLVEVNKWLV